MYRPVLLGESTPEASSKTLLMCEVKKPRKFEANFARKEWFYRFSIRKPLCFQ
jgi:hypothetical protein